MTLSGKHIYIIEDNTLDRVMYQMVFWVVLGLLFALKPCYALDFVYPLPPFGVIKFVFYSDLLLRTPVRFLGIIFRAQCLYFRRI